jgi:hypothetical protein
MLTSGPYDGSQTLVALIDGSPIGTLSTLQLHAFDAGNRHVNGKHRWQRSTGVHRNESRLKLDGPRNDVGSDDPGLESRPQVHSSRRHGLLYPVRCRKQYCGSAATSMLRKMDPAGRFVRQIELCDQHAHVVIKREHARGLEVKRWPKPG